jgi:hypothetical protein
MLGGLEMMQTCTKFLRRVAALATVFLVSGLIGAQPAQASVVRYATLEALTDEAESVVRGAVVAIETRRVDEGRRIVTLVTVRPSVTYKGEAREALQVVIDGGADGEFAQRVQGLPTFAEGEEVLLFLEGHPAPSPPGVPDRFSVLSMGLGAFRIQADRAVRLVEGLEVITGPLDEPRPLSVEEREMALPDLEARIREAATLPGDRP